MTVSHRGAKQGYSKRGGFTKAERLEALRAELLNLERVKTCARLDLRFALEQALRLETVRQEVKRLTEEML
jgi:hypothetical protein